MSTVPKRGYRISRSLRQFYSGGPFAVLPDGLLACACGGDVNLVAAADAALVATLGGDSEAVTAMTASPDGRLLFSAGHSRLIRVWDLESRKCIRSWKGHDGPVMAMACHASGGLLATAGADNKVCVWDIDGGFCTHYFRGHSGVVSTVAFHIDPKCLLLFSGGDDGHVRVWNLESKKCISILDKHFSTVTSLAFSGDGQMLLSAGRDKVVNAWGLDDYSLKKTVPIFEMVESILFVGADTGFSDFIGENELHKTKNKKRGSVHSHFLTVGEWGVVRVWSLEDAVCVFEQQFSDVSARPETDDSSSETSTRGFLEAVLLPDGQGLLCVTADQQFLFYCCEKSADGNFELKLSKRLIGYNEEILDMDFVGDEEKYLAVATNVEEVRLYNVESMSCAFLLAGHSEIVVCLDSCVSKCGRSLLVSGSKDKTVRLWDVEKRCCIGIGKGHLEAVGAVAFSKKSKNFFVSGSSDRTIKLWSFDMPEDGEKTVPLQARAVVAAHDKDINSIAVARDDNFVCTGSEDRTACVWQLPGLTSPVVLKGHKRGIWSVEFSPVDKCVLTSSSDKTIKIWAISDGSCLKTFEGHTSSVLRASYLSNGTQFVSCGSDGLVKLWTIKTNECIATYDSHEGKIWALAVGKRTEMLATGGTDAIVNLWHDCTAEDKLEDFRKKEEEVLKSQELENAVLDLNYTRAIQLAFELRKPHRLLELFSQLCRRQDLGGSVVKALAGLQKEEIRVLLEYIREWNTKPSLCHTAHSVLSIIFKIFPPTDLMEIKGISELLEGLTAYSQRHLSRIDRLVRSAFLLDYTLTRMSILDPMVGAEMTNRELIRIRQDNAAEDAAQAEQLDREDGIHPVSPEKQELPRNKRRTAKSKIRSGKKAKSVSVDVN